MWLQRDLKKNFPQLTHIQHIAFGFICPDLELKAKLTLFMYSQTMATFNFSEQVPSLSEFLALGTWNKNAICLETSK